jgi:hypothetical protein
MAQRGLQGQILHTRQQATAQDEYNYASQRDWRVILSLAPGANYLYRAQDPGIMLPLVDTDGVVFPYTPQVQVQYTANYDTSDITHSNYKIFQYKNSYVDSVTITGDFTAQDTYEANYMLAVIHFFRTITKMFYGQDSNPVNGTPPPLCYIFGLGEYQFNKHPIAITGFTYNLPNDVDYIRADVGSSAVLSRGAQASSFRFQSTSNPSNIRLGSSDVSPGGFKPPPVWEGTREGNSVGSIQPTYVPTKMQIQISAVPIVSRLDIASRFSLKDYATGKLMLGSRNGKGGGIW